MYSGALKGKANQEENVTLEKTVNSLKYFISNETLLQKTEKEISIENHFCEL